MTAMNQQGVALSRWETAQWVASLAVAAGTSMALIWTIPQFAGLFAAFGAEVTGLTALIMDYHPCTALLPLAVAAMWFSRRFTARNAVAISFGASGLVLGLAVI